MAKLRLWRRPHVFSILAAIVATWFCLGVGVRADDVQPLDARQMEIANTVTDKIIERIKALKPHYPELAKFGEAPWFTRGDGEFRYDYKIEKVLVDGKAQAKALPGGCAIYCRLYAQGAPQSKWFLYYQWASFGGLRAGISRELSVNVFKKSDDDNTNAPLVDAIRNAEQKEWDGTCAHLTSEYVLSKKGIALDTPSLLDAAENRDASMGSDALTALRFRALTPDQLARIRQDFHDGKIPIGDGQSAIEIVDEQDHAELAAFMSDLVTVSLQAEQAGKDTFQRTPFFNEAWASDARSFRRDMIPLDFKDGEPLDLDPAEKILSDDTSFENRDHALDYVAKQPGDEAQKLLIGALQNSFRGIQVEVAKIVGERKMMSAADGLRSLLKSSSPKVRTAVGTALRQLGQAVPDPIPVPPLPDSAQQIAAALWAHGLKDEDFLEVHALPWPNAQIMPALNLDEVKKVAAAYLTPDEKHEVPWEHRYPPGPFLLAAAIRFKDDDFARQVYGRMCDVYDTDDEALADGMSSLGWDRFSVALDQFHQKNDDAALPHFAEVIALSDVARPFTLLSIYVKQSKELTEYLKAKTPDKVSLVPDKSDTDAYVNYWISQLKDCDGTHPSEAGENIRSLGLRAVPTLIDALADKTPTRNFRYWRSYFPQRDIVYVSDAAKTIIGVICRDYGLNPLGGVQFANSKPLELQEKLRVWLKKVPADAKLVALGKRDRSLLHPAGEYYWGDD